jgi:hypothetical protein
VLQYITESRTYRAVGPTNRPDGPILISSRNQGFSLLVVQEPPGALKVKPGQKVKGATLCEFFDHLWEPKQLDNTDLLIFEGSSEAAKGSGKAAEGTGDSTHAALFFTTEFKEEVVFTCDATMYESILRHVYMLRAI